MKYVFITLIILIFISLSGCDRQRVEHGWAINYTGNNSPQFKIEIFSSSSLKITAPKPNNGDYPRVRLWRTGDKIPANTPYTLEVEALIYAPERHANVLVGYNVMLGEGNQHSFQHWHMLNSNSHKDYQADWSEYECYSGVPVDDEFHTFRLEHDGGWGIKYYLDGEMCVPHRSDHPPESRKLKEGDFGTPTIYFERYPAVNGDVELSDVYILEIRRFDITVGSPKLL